MWIKRVPKAIYHTFELVRCDHCDQLKPAFDFPCLNWLETSLCRKCYNKLFDPANPMEQDYIVPFSLVRDVFDHFLWNMEDFQ